MESQALQNSTYFLFVEIMLNTYTKQGDYSICFGEHLSFLYNINDNLIMNDSKYKSLYYDKPIIEIFLHSTKSNNIKPVIDSFIERVKNQIYRNEHIRYLTAIKNVIDIDNLYDVKNNKLTLNVCSHDETLNNKTNTIIYIKFPNGIIHRIFSIPNETYEDKKISEIFYEYGGTVQKNKNNHLYVMTWEYLKSLYTSNLKILHKSDKLQISNLENGLENIELYLDQDEEMKKTNIINCDNLLYVLAQAQKKMIENHPMMYHIMLGFYEYITDAYISINNSLLSNQLVSAYYEDNNESTKIWTSFKTNYELYISFFKTQYTKTHDLYKLHELHELHDLICDYRSIFLDMFMTIGYKILEVHKKDIPNVDIKLYRTCNTVIYNKTIINNINIDDEIICPNYMSTTVSIPEPYYNPFQLCDNTMVIFEINVNLNKHWGLLANPCFGTAQDDTKYNLLTSQDQFRYREITIRKYCKFKILNKRYVRIMHKNINYKKLVITMELLNGLDIPPSVSYFNNNACTINYAATGDLLIEKMNNTINVNLRTIADNFDWMSKTNAYIATDILRYKKYNIEIFKNNDGSIVSITDLIKRTADALKINKQNYADITDDAFKQFLDEIKPYNSCDNKIQAGVSTLSHVSIGDKMDIILVGESHMEYLPYSSNAFHKFIKYEEFNSDTYLLIERPCSSKYSVRNNIMDIFRLNKQIHIFDIDIRADILDEDFIAYILYWHFLKILNCKYTTIQFDKETILMPFLLEKKFEEFKEKNEIKLNYSDNFNNFIRITQQYENNIYNCKISNTRFNNMMKQHHIDNKSDNIPDIFMYNTYICEYIIYSALYIITNFICGSDADISIKNEIYLKVKSIIWGVYWDVYRDATNIANAILLDLNICINIIDIYNKNTNNKLIWICTGNKHITACKLLFDKIFKLKNIKITTDDKFSGRVPNLDMDVIQSCEKVSDKLLISDADLDIIKCISDFNGYKSELIEVFVSYDEYSDIDAIRDIRDKLIIIANIITDIANVKKLLYYIITCKLHVITFSPKNLYIYFGLSEDNIKSLSDKEIIKDMGFLKYQFSDIFSKKCNKINIITTNTPRLLKWLLNFDLNFCFAEFTYNAVIMGLKNNTCVVHKNYIITPQIKYVDPKEIIDYQLRNLIKYINNDSLEKYINDNYEKYKSQLLSSFKYNDLTRISAFMIYDIKKNTQSGSAKGGSEHIADVFLMLIFNNIIIYAILIILLLYLVYKFYTNYTSSECFSTKLLRG